jgi:hypothetical protein
MALVSDYFNENLASCVILCDLLNLSETPIENGNTSPV